MKSNKVLKQFVFGLALVAVSVPGYAVELRGQPPKIPNLEGAKYVCIADQSTYEIHFKTKTRVVNEMQVHEEVYGIESYKDGKHIEVDLGAGDEGYAGDFAKFSNIEGAVWGLTVPLVEETKILTSLLDHQNNVMMSKKAVNFFDEGTEASCTLTLKH